VDPEKLSLPEKLILKGVKAPTGDFRDWEAVRAWAQSIAEALKEPDA
jgi:menaquinone-dependent protoporphyrinogen oxidase